MLGGDQLTQLPRPQNEPLRPAQDARARRLRDAAKLIIVETQALSAQSVPWTQAGSRAEQCRVAPGALRRELCAKTRNRGAVENFARARQALIRSPTACGNLSDHCGSAPVRVPTNQKWLLTIPASKASFIVDGISFVALRACLSRFGAKHVMEEGERCEEVVSRPGLEPGTR